MIILLFLVGILGILVFSLPYLLIAANPFSQPSGKWHVGTTDLIWDQPDRSGIIAKVWHPTQISNDKPTPYIDQLDLILSTLTKGKNSKRKNSLYKFIIKPYLTRIQAPVSRDAIRGDTRESLAGC